MSRQELRDVLLSLDALPAMGESVDQLAHALQSAANAITAGADDELVLASALHDIGRSPIVRARYPALAHEHAAAEFLAPHVSERIAWLVRAHVEAKRFLVSSEDWHDKLSTRSKATLIEQGGAMTDSEARAFIARPWAQAAIALRRYDDAAKVAGALTPTIDQILDRYL